MSTQDFWNPTIYCEGSYLEGPLHEAAHSPFVIGALVEEDRPSEAALSPPGVDTYARHGVAVSSNCWLDSES